MMAEGRSPRGSKAEPPGAVPASSFLPQAQPRQHRAGPGVRPALNLLTPVTPGTVRTAAVLWGEHTKVKAGGRPLLLAAP